ncbi:MAG TPA: hypothetical protein PLV13_01595 [Ilumatobacteraceae bacterium]|nr:hypothetical protein [Ilumatobacteraceae bacterium]
MCIHTADSRPTTRRQCGQAGAALAVVLGVTLLLTIIGLALLSYIFTSLRVTDEATRQADKSRAVDAALELAVQKWRFDETLVGQSCDDLEVSRGDLVVTCDNDGVPAPTTQRRILNLTVSDGDGDDVGFARVKILDESNDSAWVGFRLQVCDWLIGAAAKSEGLRGCAA